MGPRRQQRTEAVSSLTNALTRQFGENARNIVEAHVDARLGSTKGKIERQDLDVIERGIVSTMREQRGSTKPLSKSASSPAPFRASSPVGSTQAARAFPPPTPVRVGLTPKIPIGTSNPGTVARAASTGALTPTIKKKPIRPAPYGLSITGGNEFVDESARSGVKLQPRYPVPMPPKLKPMDHWDLIVAFDSAKYRQEERDLHQTGTYAMQAKFKKTLDDQMLEIQENRDNEARGKEEERDMMLAQMDENKKYMQEEEAIVQRKKDEQGKVNTSMLGTINKYKDKEKTRKKDEEEAVTCWLNAEKLQREEDERNQKIEYARKCALAIANLEEHRRIAEERHRQEQEHEMKLMKVRDQIADEQEAKKAKALQDRVDFIEKIGRSLGGAVADRDAKDAADLEAKIKRIQEEANFKAMTDATNKQASHAAKVKDMVDTRKKQIAAKGKDDAEVLAADKRMLVTYREEHEESKRLEAIKTEKRRQAREDQDRTLIGQIRINAGIHPHHVMMTPRNKKTELGYNKCIFDQMSKESFMIDNVNALMANPGKDHHPEGKLLPFPTIPRYQGEIHPIELEQPDV